MVPNVAQQFRSLPASVTVDAMPHHSEPLPPEPLSMPASFKLPPTARSYCRSTMSSVETALLTIGPIAGVAVGALLSGRSEARRRVDDRNQSLNEQRISLVVQFASAIKSASIHARGAMSTRGMFNKTGPELEEIASRLNVEVRELDVQLSIVGTPRVRAAAERAKAAHDAVGGLLFKRVDAADEQWELTKQELDAAVAGLLAAARNELVPPE